MVYTLDIKEYLNSHKEKVNKYLNSYFSSKKTDFKQYSAFVQKQLGDLEEFTMRGGKRIRPTLMYHAYKMFQPDGDDSSVIELSIFLELIQSFLLIHDDIIDRSFLRRHGDTIHKIYEKYALTENFNDSKYFGMSMGILIGDLSNQFAFEIIANAQFDERKIVNLIDIVQQYLSEVLFGQSHDILLACKEDYSESCVLKVQEQKTALYTFVLPLLSGGAIAGVENGQLEILKKYGKAAGTAFQIQDDIFGLFGSEEKIGKDVISDLQEGKKTLLMTKALENANDSQRGIILSNLGKSDVSYSELEQVRKVVIDTGSLEYAYKMIREFVDLAIAKLSELDCKNEHWFVLKEIAEYLANIKI